MNKTLVFLDKISDFAIYKGRKLALIIIRLIYKIFLAGGYLFWLIVVLYFVFAKFFDDPPSHKLPGNYIIWQQADSGLGSISDRKKKTVLKDIEKFGFCGQYVYGSTYGDMNFVLDTKSGRLSTSSKIMDGIDFSKYRTEELTEIIENRKGNLHGIGWKKCY